MRWVHFRALTKHQFAWAIACLLQGRSCSSDIYYFVASHTARKLGKWCVESHFTQSINPSILNFFTISDEAYAIMLLVNCRCHEIMRSIGLDQLLGMWGWQYIWAEGWRGWCRMLIMNQTPKIQSTRRWNPSGQGEWRSRRTFSLMIFGAKREKRYIEIGITLKKMRDNDCINQLHYNEWIDYNKETKLFHTTLSG